MPIFVLVALYLHFNGYQKNIPQKSSILPCLAANYA